MSQSLTAVSVVGNRTVHIRHQNNSLKLATDIKLTLALKKWTTFKYRLELLAPDVSK